MPDNSPIREPLLDLPDDEPIPNEMLGVQVQKAQEQLLSLKRQAELIEKQKRELEELSRRQEELEHGKGEMIEKLTRSIVVLERETYEAEKRVEQLRGTRETFSDHLQLLESINPKNWHQSELQKELSKAISAVDQARTEYNQSRSRINAESTEEVLDAAPSHDYADAFGGDRDFVYWLKSGFAFTLPLVLLGLIALVVVLMRTVPAP